MSIIYIKANILTNLCYLYNINYNNIIKYKCIIKSII